MNPDLRCASHHCGLAPSRRGISPTGLLLAPAVPWIRKQNGRWPCIFLVKRQNELSVGRCGWKQDKETAFINTSPSPRAPQPKPRCGYHSNCALTWGFPASREVLPLDSRHPCRSPRPRAEGRAVPSDNLQAHPALSWQAEGATAPPGRQPSPHWPAGQRLGALRP